MASVEGLLSEISPSNKLTHVINAGDQLYYGDRLLYTHIEPKFKYESVIKMITTPEIICDIFFFLHKDQIERVQLVNQFWNNVIICHKNILPLRQFNRIGFNHEEIYLYATTERKKSYRISYYGTYLYKNGKKVASRYSQLTVAEVLNNLNDVVFDIIEIKCYVSEHYKYNLLNMIKLVTTKTGGRFRGRFGLCDTERFDSKLNEIFDNYIIVDQLDINIFYTYRREVCANPEIVQYPSTPKEIRLSVLLLEEDEEVLHLTCNGKLNGANRLTIVFATSDTNYGNFIRQWFELYRTHQNPISLVGKFKLRISKYLADSVLDAVKTLLNNTQLRVKYSLEKFHRPIYGTIYHYLKRHCVLHETDSSALVIEMAYRDVTDMSSINASDLDQPPCNKMQTISLCVKSL